MQVILEEKEIWDIVDGSRVNPITAAQTKKKEKNNVVTSQIIK